MRRATAIYHNHNHTMNQDFTWNTFLTHLDCTFRDLVTERHFADVTLVSDDQVQIKAHKIILSSCSPVLKKLLLDNPHPHPMIYMSGVKHEQLESILQWMYFGETNVYKDNIEEFIEIGKDLEVQELIKVAMDSEDLVNIFTENVAKSLNDNQTRSEPSTNDEFTNGNIAQYDDTKGVTHSCNECYYKTGYKSTLRRHKQSKHEDVMYSCSECEFKQDKVQS